MNALAALAERIGPVLAFLVAVTVVAEVCALAGLFDVAAHQAAARAGGHVLRLWLLLVAIAVVSTVVLSLDTTAVLLTPVAITVARQVGAPAMPFAMTTLWLANTASLLLPVSNLTNLLALHPLGAIGVGTRDYVHLMAAPAVTAALVTVLVLWLIHRRDLGGRYEVAPPPEPHDRGLLVGSAAACGLLAVLFVAGVPPWMATLPVALALLGVTYWRAPELLSRVTVPWLTVLGICALFVLIDLALGWGLESALRSAAGAGTSTLDLLRLALLAAGLANGINNLPAYLALEPAASSDPERLAALLIGVNTGPLVLTWGSVATLLWLDRCRGAGLSVSWRRLATTGLVCASAVVVTATLALAVQPRA